MPEWGTLLKIQVEARPKAIWTLAIEFAAGPRLLRFRARDGEWIFSPLQRRCAADGDTSPSLDTALRLLPAAPPGCVIAKVGGSIVGRADGSLFTIGSLCILELDAKTRGSVFLTVNDDPLLRTANQGSIEVEIADALP
jgi:hypothetical protein